MATTRFNNNILAAARRLQAPRTSAASSSDTNSQFTSALLSEYQNRAIKDIISEKYDGLREKFGDVIPEYVTTSGALVPDGSGIVTKPVDAWYLLDAYTVDGVKLWKIPDAEIGLVITGIHGLIIPSAVTPFYYTEGRNIHVLPASLGKNIIVRYVKIHTDISVITVANGSGNYRTGGGSYTLATRTLVATMNASFASTDVNKQIALRDSTGGGVYFGRIESVTNATTVVLKGDGLPVGNLASVGTVLVSDLDDSTNDLKLPATYDSAIVDKMVGYGQTDRGQ